MLTVSRLLTSTANDFEAEVIRGRLADAGIEVVVKGGLPGRYGNVVGARDIYVEEDDFERASEAMKAGEGFNEDELAALSEQAGREQGAAED
jgi:Putative prokaryotic signal transducing protein